jgi:hypothetical protein
MNNLCTKYGLWIVGDKMFDDNYQALLHASQTNQTVKFWYHHETFKSVDRTSLGKVSLNSLYKERAQQLRDNYDYLILYYSGGADSHNILKTYIDNDIKLDEVCVKWPKPLLDHKWYIPNTTDTTAKNYWSEWDYCVKPILEWLAKNKPDIKITIKDYTMADELDMDEKFSTNMNHGFRAGILLNSVVSDSEEQLISKGKTVANIYGLDKPLLLLHEGKINMFFSDNAIVTGYRSMINPTGSEYFYWSPDMPNLAFEQAYHLSLHYKANSNLKQFLFTVHNKDKEKINNQMQQEIARHVLYDNWDSRFQATKANTTKLDKFSWFFEQSELTRTKEIFLDNISQRTSLLADRFLTGTNEAGAFKTVITSTTTPYYVTILD